MRLFGNAIQNYYGTLNLTSPPGAVALTINGLTATAVATKAKLADTSLASTTALTADPDLQIAIPTTGTYGFELLVKINGPAAAGIAMEVTYSGTLSAAIDSTFGISGLINGTSLTAVTGLVQMNSPGPSYSTLSGVSDQQYAILTGSFQCSTTGTFTFLWAQNTSNVSNTTIRKGSYLKMTRLA